MPNYRLVISYDGAPFRGFAKQSGLQGVRTVQGELESFLSKVLREEVSTSAAGRTDAGVHALGQVVSFRTEAALNLEDLTARLNSVLGPEIAVLEAAEAGDGFDARFAAISRTYEYAILVRPTHDPFSRHTTWHHPAALDIPAMQKAAAHLVGEHDFSSFGRVENNKSAVRNLDNIELHEEGELLVIRITANSFIQQMVRSIVGTLVKVGEGKLSPDQIPSILEARDRSAAGPVAPPHGLFLVSVAYPQELV